jgi:hypothetical protein
VASPGTIAPDDQPSVARSSDQQSTAMPFTTYASLGTAISLMALLSAASPLTT